MDPIFVPAVFCSDAKLRDASVSYLLWLALDGSEIVLQQTQTALLINYDQ